MDLRKRIRLRTQQLRANVTDTTDRMRSWALRYVIILCTLTLTLTLTQTRRFISETKKDVSRHNTSSVTEETNMLRQWAQR